MPSPDRTFKFVAFLFALFTLGLLSPVVGIAVSALVIYWFELDGPWPTIVLAVISCSTTVAAVFAALRLDDLRRRRT